MATSTIASSGGDYTSMSAWEAAKAGDLVTATEGETAEFETFGSGLTDDDAFTGWTTNDTYFITLRAASGSEPDFSSAKQGFYFNGTANAIVRPVTGADHFLIEDIEVDHADTGSTFYSSVNGGGQTATLRRCVIRNASGDACPFAASGDDIELHQSLIVDPGDDGVVTASVCNQVTVVNAGNRGIVCDTGSAVTECFAIGSTNDDWDDQGGTHDYNAGGDATAPGTTTYDSRTTADFADNAGGDFRTASGSTLATGGASSDFIGCALEPGSSQSPVPIISQKHWYGVQL